MSWGSRVAGQEEAVPVTWDTNTGEFADSAPVKVKVPCASV